jgi:phosphohistidine phosphatase SixA
MTASRIIILRHAEKTGVDTDPELSERGRLRAAVLSAALPQYFGKIDHVIAAQSTEHSARPLRTVEPLSMALGIRVQQRWKTAQYKELAAALFSDPEFEQRQVLICWRHKSLQALARALGAADAEPWSETEYDRTWLIDLPTCTLAVLRQRLDGKELSFASSK